MKVIRGSIFETNSSSTHALAIVLKYGNDFYYSDSTKLVLDDKGVCYFSRLGSKLSTMIATPYEKVRYIIGLKAASLRMEKGLDYNKIPVRWLTRNKEMKAFFDDIKKILKKGGYNVKRFNFTSVRNSKTNNLRDDYDYCGEKEFESNKNIIWNEINHEVVEMVNFYGTEFDGFSLEEVILRQDIGIYYWFNG